MTETIDSMNRQAKTILFVLGKLRELKEKGLVEGGNLEQTLKGRFEYEMLVQSGFQPSEEEIHRAMDAIQARCVENRQ